MHIYEQLVNAGVPLDHHESDLYALVTPASSQIVSQYGCKRAVTRFISQIDGKLWYDIPFEYLPFWEAAERRANK